MICKCTITVLVEVKGILRSYRITTILMTLLSMRPPCALVASTTAKSSPLPFQATHFGDRPKLRLSELIARDYCDVGRDSINSPARVNSAQVGQQVQRIKINLLYFRS